MIDERDRRLETDKLRRELHDWRNEVREQFRKGEERSDRQDAILQRVEGLLAIYAFGRVAGPALMWVLKAASLVAIIFGAIFWHK